MPEPITVNKLNTERELIWSYAGHVLERTPTDLKLEARFNRKTSDAGYVVFEKNDRFVEYYYTDRWYNIFEIHAVKDDHLKGWYCNIAQPAEIQTGLLEQIDLALDVWIAPDGSTLLLDEDEFRDLKLDPEKRAQACRGLDELLDRVQRREPPFDSITQA
jgi:predicted RNA-binding protein associated with RNAse of E/G family